MASGAKRPDFRDAVIDYCEKFYQKPFDNLTSSERSKGLTRYYLINVYGPLHEEIDDDEIEQGFVDGSNDLGVDFVYRDGEMVFLVQSKYRTKNSRESRENVEAFKNLVYRLWEAKKNKKLVPNKRLKEFLADINFERDIFILHFISTGVVEGNAEEVARAAFYQISDLTDLHQRQSIEIFDLEKLTQEYKTALSHGGIPEKVEFYIEGPRGEKGQCLELKSGDYRTVICAVKANEIVSLYKRRTNREKLFTLNIRNYLGSTATNKELIKTLNAEPEYFLSYNNGISCVCSDLKIDGKKVIAERFQVINGAQTVRCIVRASENTSFVGGDARVMLKITDVPEFYGKSGRFFDNIIKYNNTQNVVKLADFRSNDPVQVDFQRKFKELGRIRGKAVYYRAKRTDRISSDALVIKMEEFAKVLYSFRFNPVDFAARTSILFDASESGAYCKIFGDDSGVWSNVSDEIFQSYSGIWFVAFYMGELLKKEKERVVKEENEDEQGTILNALERKWFLIYLLKLILSRVSKENSPELLLKKFYKGDWLNEHSGKDRYKEDLKGYFVAAKDALIYRYKEASKREGFNHRNWTRSKLTVDDLTTFVESAPFLGSLPQLDPK